MTRAQYNKEILTAERYLANARSEYHDYHTKNNLIGYALLDQVKRMRIILQLVKQGIPFGVGKNK
jgi:hypothetical protein